MSVVNCSIEVYPQIAVYAALYIGSVNHLPETLKYGLKPSDVSMRYRTGLFSSVKSENDILNENGYTIL